MYTKASAISPRGRTPQASVGFGSERNMPSDGDCGIRSNGQSQLSSRVYNKHLMVPSSAGKPPKFTGSEGAEEKKFESLISNVSIMSIFAIKVGKLLQYPL